MSMPEDSVLESRLRECVSDAVPPEVESRLRARLTEFRSRLNAPEAAAATPAVRARLTARWKLGLTCAAAGLLVAVLGLLWWPRTSLADVAAAVLQQSWIHQRVATTGDGESELWYSPARNIAATRRPNRTTYEDFRLEVVDSYETKENVVYHVPIASRRSEARVAGTLVEVLAILLQAERLSEKALAPLDFLGPLRTTMRVLDQAMEKVTEAGQTWLDYRLTVADPSSEQPLRIFFRVDAATKLPVLCRFDGRFGGKPATFETRIDYPERGPADIYDLGVPRTAQRVDRVPAGDLKRIMETIKASRERMDDYRAVFVEHYGDPDHNPNYRWWIDYAYILYRKGAKFRTDWPDVSNGNLPDTKRPDQGEDLGKWWRERTKSFRYYPKRVLRGTTYFVSNVKDSRRPDRTLEAEIVSVETTEQPEHFPLDYSMRPELACRPPMGLGAPDMEPVLEMRPPDGPPGCVRLSIRHTSDVDRINEKGIGIPDEYRYWLDPQRDFIAVRTDWVLRDAAGQEKVINRVTVEEAARSPQGVWYATKIRRSCPDPVGKAKYRDQIYEFYVDFDVNLPDSLFEPPKPGKIR